MMLRGVVIFLHFASFLTVHVEAIKGKSNELLFENCDTLYIDTAFHGKYC